MSRKHRRKSSPDRTQAQDAVKAGSGEDWTPRSDTGGRASDQPPDRPSIGMDMRRMDRISQRELGRVSMSMKVPGGPWVPVKLWDFTSIGFGVLHESERGGSDPILGRSRGWLEESEPGESERDPKATALPIKSGDEVEIRIQVRSQEEFNLWCQVKNVQAWRGGTKLGLRRLDITFPQPVNLERRLAVRLPLSPSLSLKARVKHPFLFGHWSPLQVSDINQNLGISFQSADPSILLFEGMTLSIHFDLSSFRNLPMLVRVIWVHALEADSVKFGIECLEMDWRLQEGICDLLLLSRNWTPLKLREAGFRVQRVKSHLRFRTVKSMEDYAEVLHLRRDAYVGAGKRAPSTLPEEMATPLDGKSRILMAKHHGVLVGSLTFTFPATEDSLLDSQAGFPGHKYPVRLPPKANLIEVSRLCIDDRYRGTDLLVGLFEHGLKHFLMSDRHWLITSATNELLPLYQRIGFIRLKASYKHPLLNNQEHHLIIAHKSAFLWGLGIGVLTWNSVFGDLIQYLMERKLVPLPGWMRFIIRSKLLLRPLARRLSDSKARKGFRKHLAALRTARQGDTAGSMPPRAGRIEGGSIEAIASDEAPSTSLFNHVEVEAPLPKDAKPGP